MCVFSRFEMAPVKRTLKAEPVMGEKYRGKKISRKDFERQKVSPKKQIKTITENILIT
jgi:hypothetical protein